MEDIDKSKEQLIRELEVYRQRVAGLELLTEVSRTISSTLHLQTILTEVARLCCIGVDATSVYVGTVNLEAGTTTVVAEYFSPAANAQERRSDLGVEYDMEKEFPSLVKWAKNPVSHIIIHADEPQSNPEGSAHLAAYGGKSLLTVPFMAGDEFTGYIELWESRRKRTFTDDEARLILSVASQVSMVVANARLYENLHKSEGRYRVVAELVSDYAYRYGLYPELKLLQIWPNEAAFTQITGYRADEYDTNYGIYHPDERARVERDVQRTLQGIPTQGEYRILTKDGDVRWIYVHRRPEWDDSGQSIIGFYGAAQDITERKELEIQLAYQAILLQNVSDAVISADAEWNFKTWNKGAERMYGWTEEEVIGSNVLELFRTEYYDDTTSEEAVQDFLEKGQWAGEGLHRRKDGTQLPVHISSSPVRDKSGQIIGTVAVIRDYTTSKDSENQRLEIALQQERIQLLEELIADLSHDLKTPLTGITTMVYLIQKNPDPSKQAHYLDKLEAQVQRLSDLLEAILTMSRLDKGPGLTFAPLAIKSLISDVHTQVHHLVAEKNLTMSLDLSDSLPPILGNETELNRAFANLIINAINYTPPGGSIGVRTYQEDGRVFVAIHDTGMGIARDELPRIFERFYRVDGARNTDQGGTGLGLAIVKRIVELHSGQIQVDSEPGSGSTFRITLPTVPHPDA